MHRKISFPIEGYVGLIKPVEENKLSVVYELDKDLSLPAAYRAYRMHKVDYTICRC